MKHFSARRSFSVVIGALGPGWERSRLSTLPPDMNRRVACAMNCAEEQCATGRRL